MSKDDVLKVIRASVIDYFESQGINSKVNDNTPLFGSLSFLDSMGLVNVIVDIESKLLDNDVEICLTSESAMSRSRSPFRTVETLADFILEQLHHE